MQCDANKIDGISSMRPLYHRKLQLEMLATGTIKHLFARPVHVDLLIWAANNKLQCISGMIYNEKMSKHINDLETANDGE